MIMGTGSGCGKSLLVTALCRIYANRGFRVAPFKAQNMSLNSAVTADGREIARAQWLQAVAARTEPRAEMNPILLKPKGELTSQVIALGLPYADLTVHDYYRRHRYFCSLVGSSLARLRAGYDLVIAEGAGSPAEINLRRYDLANLTTARLADAPVLLVADISLGGAFANLVGHLSLFAPADRKRVKGFALNKFRGSPEILEPGIRWLERRTKRPVVGVLPSVDDLGLPQEDSLWEWRIHPSQASIAIGVVRLPHLSNSTDFEVFAQDGVRVAFARTPSQLSTVDALVLPGTKNTVDDLQFLQKNGWVEAIRAMHAAGLPLVGICGGYQMLGRQIRDPLRIESSHGSVPGLGLLPVVTEFTGYRKTLRNVEGRIHGGWFLDGIRGARVKGYEIRMGEVKRLGGRAPIVLCHSGTRQTLEGCVRKGVLGVSFHGFFDNPEVRTAFLNTLRARRGLPRQGCSAVPVEQALERWAEIVQKHLDLDTVNRWVGMGGP